MKQRLLVMNGQKIVQAEQGGAWTNQRVDKAGLLKPGIYNLYLAKPAGKSERHEGVVVQTDDEHVYQKSGKGFVMHARTDFAEVPEIGTPATITYDPAGSARVASGAPTLTRGRSR